MLSNRTVQHVNSELAIHVQRNDILMLSDRVPKPDGGKEWGRAVTRYIPHLCYVEREATIRLP